MTLYRRYGKRMLDVAVASVGLVLAAPVMAVVAIAILCRMGPPILFGEPRARMHGAPFLLKKFRTMTDGVDRDGQPLPDEQRLTPLGRQLRSASLDELPELVHVLRGEMSLVGPRPLPVRYVARYTAAQARRLQVKPGITGLAQIRGRNGLSWEEKFQADVEYVENISLWLDLRLLAATLVVVVKGQGISQPGHATMEEFSGPVR
jgi:sugar transferase EpsL